MAFDIGDKVIYPNHGLGVIERIETKTIMGTTCGFYQLRMANETTVFVPVDIVNEGPREVTVKDVRLVVDGIAYAPSQAPSNLVGSKPWLDPGPLRLRANDAISGDWYFGPSLWGGGLPVAVQRGSVAELFVAPVGRETFHQELNLVHLADRLADSADG